MTALPILGLTLVALAAGGEVAAIVLQWRALALATLVVYGVGLALLAWWRFPFALLVLVVVLPLVTVEVGLGDVEKTVSADKVALVAIVVVWWARRGRAAARGLWRVVAVRWWLLFLGLVGLSALAHGLSPGELWSVAGQVVYFSVFCLVLETLDRPDRGMEARDVLLAAGLGGSLVAIVALFEWGLLVRGHVIRMYFKQGTMAVVHTFGSTIGHTNFMAGYLAMIFAVLVVVWFSTPTARRWWAGAGCALVAVVLGRARSAGSLLGLMTAALFALGPVLSTFRSRRMRVAVISAVLIVLAAAGWIAFGKLTGGPYPIEVRQATSRIGLVAVSERPLVGFGARGFSRESVRIERLLFGHLRFHPEGEPLSAHNAFLDLAVERGVPALAAFVGVLASILTAGIQGYRRSSDPARRIVIAGLTAGLLAFIVQAFTENLFSYSKVASIFWILAAVLVHLAASDERTSHRHGVSPLMAAPRSA